MDATEQTANGSRYQPNGTMRGGYQSPNPTPRADPYGRGRGQAGLDRMPFFRGRGQEPEQELTPYQEMSLRLRANDAARQEAKDIMEMSIRDKKAELEHQKTLGAIAAIEDLHGLNPKSPGYQKAKLGVMRQHAQYLDHPDVKGFMAIQDEEFGQWRETEKELMDGRTKEEKERDDAAAKRQEWDATEKRRAEMAKEDGLVRVGALADGRAKYDRPPEVDEKDAVAEWNKKASERLKAFGGSKADIDWLSEQDRREEGDNTVFTKNIGTPTEKKTETLRLPTALVAQLEQERNELFGFQKPAAASTTTAQPGDRYDVGGGGRPVANPTTHVDQFLRQEAALGNQPVRPDNTAGVMRDAVTNPGVKPASYADPSPVVDVDELFIQGLRKLGQGK